MTASETLVHGLEATFWVSVLTLAVLALRGPVTRRFGSRAAMLLWSLPAIRLLMPAVPKTETVVLGPVATGPSVTGPGVAELSPVRAGPDVATDAVFLPGEAPSAAQASGLGADLLAQWQGLLTADMMAALVLSLWFLGVLVAGGLCVGRAAAWRRTLLAEAVDAPEGLAEMAGRMARRAGTRKPFTLVVSGAADTPQLMGLRRPLLAVPKDFTTRYDEQEQEMALLHELLHLKRCDLCVLSFSEACFALQWFNPLTRHARRALRADQEAACDEAVRDRGIGARRYAALLVKAASAGRPVPALTLDHSLKERIIRMQTPLSGRFRRHAFILVAGVSALAVAGFTASTTTVTNYVHPDHEEAQDEPRKVEDEEWERFIESLADGRDGEDPEAAARGVIDRLAERARETGREVRLLRADTAETLVLSGDGTAMLEEALGDDNVRVMKFRMKVEEEARGLGEGGRAEASSSGDGRRVIVLNMGEGDESRVRVITDADGEILTEDALAPLAGDGGFAFEIVTTGEGGIALENIEGPRHMGLRGDGAEVTEVLVPGEDGARTLRIRTERKKGEDIRWRQGDRLDRGRSDDAMILLSDPFADVRPPRMEPPKPPSMDVKPPKVEKRTDERGTWILLPTQPDMTAFETAMEAFEEEMEAFGEEMEAFGERMEAVGESIEDLSERCARHRERSNDPVILKERVPGGDATVKAVCVRGGAERYRSAEMIAFVEGSDLSAEEKAHYRRSVDRAN